MTPDDLPRWVRWTLYADVRIMLVLIRPVWWIDHRFHFNSYRQARVVMLAAMALHLVGFALLMTSAALPWFGKTAFGFASFAYLTMELPWLRKLEKASRDYERDPDGMSFERAFFFWQPVPPLRLMMLTIGVQLFLLMCAVAAIPPAVPARDVGVVLFNSWTMISAMALYVAAIPPPTRPRKKKEERAPLGALPSPA